MAITIAYLFNFSDKSGIKILKIINPRSRNCYSTILTCNELARHTLARNYYIYK